MTDMLIIRKCLEADITWTGVFYDSVVRWLDAHINYPRWIYQIYPSEGYVREMTAAGAQYICLENDRIVGAFCLNDEPQAGYHTIRWSRDLADGSFLIIHALAIDPAVHRQGLGSKILQFCINAAVSEGYRALRVDIVPDNFPARNLFEKTSFQYAGDADLGLGSAGIPYFSLYELNLPD